ncbi:hypothetical protein [Micromonospora sp. WMMD980]|uniref:hypothetical protein n=1 Tax=Micromonospora sp. WMMD980 TaxID=3016088 RepID=UPI002415F348|nr:hypothetical protein [Micromonospora sp. WMMD980]MDG4799054.1 hypothetical protein [Micromonospora sp. WMMD980]
MADRDVTVDIIARDKTAAATGSAARSLKQVEKSWKDVDGQGKRTVAAAKEIAGQWGRGLAKVSGAASKWANSGDSAGKRFARGIGSGISKVGQLGASIGGGLSKAVSAAGPYVQVAMAAVLVGAAISAAPAVAGAIVGGAGLGGVVGGLLIASKDARVASAFDDLKEDLGSGLQEAAGRFVPATLSAVRDARSAFRGLLPDLRRIFDVSATWLGPLTRSIGRGTQAMLDGITQAVTKAGPIVNVIGQGIEMIGRAIGGLFAGLSDNGESMALALKGVFALVAGAIQQAGIALNFLTETFEFFVKRIPGGTALLRSMTASQDGAKSSAFNLAGSFQALADEANGTAAGLTKAKQAADELVGSNISLSRAQIASRDAVREATKAVKENNNAKLTNSQRSDRQMSTLLNLADAFNTETAAGEKSKISANAASEAYARNRTRLVNMAIAAGKSRAEAERLAAKLLTIPKNVNTDVNVDTSGATAKLATFQKRINGLRGKTVTVQIRTNGDHYIPGVGTQLKNALGDTFRPGEAAGVYRSGGPTQVEVESTVLVNLDGRPFRQMTASAIAAERRRERWRQKVGAR